MNRQTAMKSLIGHLAGIDSEDEFFDEKVDRLVFCESNFPGFAETIATIVRTKIYRKYPVTEEVCARAAQLQAAERLVDEGLGEMYTSDFVQMEVEHEHRSWGRVKTYAPACKQTQTLFSKFLRSGKSSDMRKTMTSARWCL